MRAKSGKKPIAIHTSSDKLEMIRSGKRKKTVTGFKENKNITIQNEKGKFIAVEKEKKFEEAGVTKKKKNFIMFESKLGTERERDMHKIEGARLKATPGQRVEEKIIIQKKRKEYLDNYQYQETKNLKDSKPDTVVHIRWGDIVGGSKETTTVTKTTQRGGSVDKNRGRNQAKPDLRQNNTASNLRSKPQGSATGKKTVESTTKVGRRGGAGGKTSTTTTTKTETKTTRTRGGDTKTSTKTTTTKGGETKTSTRTTRGRK
jgi:hypothetical protein